MAMVSRPSLMIAVGLPGHHGEQDEDNLNRERDGNGDDDIATEAVCSVVRNLHKGGPSAVRDLRAHANALLELADAWMARDQERIADAASKVCDTLRDLIS